jgi:tetratricopeptide (TPR) repeat protein
LNFTLPVVLSATLAIAQSSAPAPAPTTPAAPAAQAVAPGAGNAVWASTAEEAQTRASREGKLVFFEFVTAECGLCKRMEGLLYPAVDFDALLASMVPVQIDLDSPAGKEIAGRYGLREAPAILITTPEGRLVFLMEGFFNQADFFRRVNADLRSYESFSKKLESQDITKLSAKDAFESGNELYRRSDPEAALPRLRRAVAASGASTGAREDALEILAAVELELGQFAASRKTIERLITTTKDRAKRERGELFRAQIPLAENRPAEALALFRKFQKDHPTSPHIAHVNDFVQRLEERTARP